MKRFYANNYSRIVILSWSVIVFLLWLQYIHLSTLLEATLFLIILIPAIFLSGILTNIWLPRAVHRKRMKFFVFQFTGITLLIALFLAACFLFIRWAGAKGYFPHSIILADNNSFIVDFLYAIPSTLVINFGFCGLRLFYEHLKLQRIHLETQLQVLQSQVNPHFTFNVLNHIHVLMQTDVELASGLLLQYSDMLRFQLYKGKCDKVRLDEEIQFLRNFVEIEKLRWGNRVNVNAKWTITDRQVEVPPLLLIAFIENAFKYVSGTVSGKGFVNIAFVQQKESFSLIVENSKPPVIHPKDTRASGLGLNNTRQRLNLLYGENYKLMTEDKEDTYYTKLEIWAN